MIIILADEVSTPLSALGPRACAFLLSHVLLNWKSKNMFLISIAAWAMCKFGFMICSFLLEYVEKVLFWMEIL